MTYWWLSFCDGSRPRGQQHLGCSIVPLDGDGDVGLAAMAAHMLGCNPGGDVLGYPWATEETPVPQESVGRLLTKDEATALDEEMYRLYPKNAAPVIP